MENKSQIIHDMNSSLAALDQALLLMDENWSSNEELVDKILPLSREKMTEILVLWGQIKLSWGKA